MISAKKVSEKEFGLEIKEVHVVSFKIPRSIYKKDMKNMSEKMRKMIDDYVTRNIDEKQVAIVAMKLNKMMKTEEKRVISLRIDEETLRKFDRMVSERHFDRSDILRALYYLLVSQESSPPVA